MSKIKCIGIIAEDDSDFESSKILIKKIIKKNISFKKIVTNGCGSLQRKLFSHAVTLKNRGCDLLIVFHDLDKNRLVELKYNLEKKLNGNPFNSYFVCIPVEEIEAWFLSDPESIKKTFRLNKLPKIKGTPEGVSSPKEKLGEYVRIYSNNQALYLNTKHNSKLADNSLIDNIKQKCKSFKELVDFLQTQKF